MKSHESLEKSIRQLGAKAVAAELGVSASLVYKWCEATGDEGASGSTNPLDRLLAIVEQTGDAGPIDWLCEQTGSYRVLNPRGSDGRELTSVLDALRTILKEFTDVLDAVSDADRDGRGIDGTEAEQIRAEWEELKREAESFVVACEGGVYAQARGGGAA